MKRLSSMRLLWLAMVARFVAMWYTVWPHSPSQLHDTPLSAAPSLQDFLALHTHDTITSNPSLLHFLHHTLSLHDTPSLQNSPEIQKHLFSITPFLAEHSTPSLQHALFKALSSTPKKSTKHSLPAILSLSAHSLYTSLDNTHTHCRYNRPPLYNTLQKYQNTPLLQHSSSLYVPSLQQSPFYNTLFKKIKKKTLPPHNTPPTSLQHSPSLRPKKNSHYLILSTPFTVDTTELC